MIIMEKDDLYVIEDFVAQFQSKLNLLKDHMELFNLPHDRLVAYEKTVEMLEDKLKQMKKAKNKKDLKKVLKLKKLLEDKSYD